jgi:hypothetical protein
MNRVARAGFLLLILSAIAGCGSTSQPASQSVGRVTYEVSGGFTGWHRILTVEADGTARVQVVRGPSPNAATHQVEKATIDRLHSLVSDPAFAQLEPAYLPAPGGADLQDYVVTVEVDGRTIKTMTRDGARPPQILRDVLAILNQILALAAAR